MACQTNQPIQSKTQSNQSPVASGITLDHMDKNIRPQDDFYRHVNGHWLDNFEIPADKSNYGSFIKLSDESRQHVKEIIMEVSSHDNPAGSTEQKIADIYASWMDTARLQELGMKPLADEMARINNIASKKDLSAYMAYADIYSHAPLRMYVYIDQKQSDTHIVYMSQSGLGLPDRDYYFKEGEQSQYIRDEYQNYMAKLFELAEFEDSIDIAANVYQMEEFLARGHWTRIQNRDRDKTYNKLTFGELKALLPNLDWDAWLSESMIEQPEQLIVSQPDYLTTFNQALTEFDVDLWTDYFRWQLLRSAAPYLSSEFEQASFAFYGTVLTGTPEQEPRWQRGVNLVNGLIGELVGKIYVEKHFPPEAKQRMNVMIENLREAYGDSIRDLDWMSDATKEKALVKLAKFNPKVGYPDQWRDYSNLIIQGDNLVANLIESNRFLAHRNRSKLGQPIDRHEWGMNPQRVNAYYNPTKNEIVFPAAILQPPFFNLEADEAVNYGGIGAVIGHEMGHGFDDQGSKYDGDGNLKNWWTEEDRQRFDERTAQLIKQYDAFTVLDGVPVKGEFTQGENIGDLSGMAIAYKAFKNNYTDDLTIDGYTPDQRFFLGWAQVWMRKYRDEELLKRIETDPHSPSEFRTNGILRNLPEFYEAFDVKPGDGMYLPPEDRVKIW
ncbi:MAG: M13 family peptidase [Proteobacteria bacterium]|nr:MAG: M13 family peptidase [Pseudomonadota bacterium]